jgi:hypothetical protein
VKSADRRKVPQVEPIISEEGLYGVSDSSNDDE